MLYYMRQFPEAVYHNFPCSIQGHVGRLRAPFHCLLSPWYSFVAHTKCLGNFRERLGESGKLNPVTKQEY